MTANPATEPVASVQQEPISVHGVRALEILDSRSRPTLMVSLSTDRGTWDAGVPSGASTGTREAVELRDGDPSRYGGSGVQQALTNVNGPIAERLKGATFQTQQELDEALIELDGTPTKSRLGANAIVGVSMAGARAFAAAAGTPLWRSLTPTGVTPRIPLPHFNVVNGGAHAANALDFQEFMIAPSGASDVSEAVRTAAEVYARLRTLLSQRGFAVGLGDEGGFAPDLRHPEEVLDLLVEAITASGHRPGADGVTIALDPAASEFFHDGSYQVAGRPLSSDDMIGWYERLVDQYPISSIEDGLAEDDGLGWVRLTERLGPRVQLVGDDNFVTNPAIIREAIAGGVANAALIKVNQVGTVSETLDALAVCREAGYGAMISHRSGETPDSFIADLAVGSGCGQIKSGAPARGERVAKYNRLLQISADEPALPFGRGRATR